jgi:hypothetical protein
MKKYITIFLTCIILFICGCSTQYYFSNNFDYKFSEYYKIDSVCCVEKIPTDKSKWNKTAYITDETSFYQYIYVINKDSFNITYTITDLDSLFRIKKNTVIIE